MELVPNIEAVCVITQRRPEVVVTVLVAPINQRAVIMDGAQVDKRHITFLSAFAKYIFLMYAVVRIVS